MPGGGSWPSGARNKPRQELYGFEPSSRSALGQSEDEYMAEGESDANDDEDDHMGDPSLSTASEDGISEHLLGSSYSQSMTVHRSPSSLIPMTSENDKLIIMERKRDQNGTTKHGELSYHSNSSNTALDPELWMSDVISVDADDYVEGEDAEDFSDWDSSDDGNGFSLLSMSDLLCALSTGSPTLAPERASPAFRIEPRLSLSIHGTLPALAYILKR